jgi:hypothetical protein
MCSQHSGERRSVELERLRCRFDLLNRFLPPALLPEAPFLTAAMAVSSADVFARKLIKPLPAPLQRNMWGKIATENAVIAVNSRGEYFYDQ